MSELNGFRLHGDSICAEGSANVHSRAGAEVSSGGFMDQKRVTTLLKYEDAKVWL